MLLSFINKYLVNSYYAINIHFSGNEEQFSYVHLQKKGNSLKILNQNTVATFESLTDNVKKGTPVIASFTGKSIISKVIAKEENYLDKIIFNQKIDDFYTYEILKGERLLISIARKKEIDKYLSFFNEKNISVIDFSIGPFILQKLIEFLPNVSAIKTKYFEYNSINNKLNIIKNDESVTLDDISINDEKFKNDSLLSFSAFLSYLNRNKITTNFNEKTNLLESESLYKKAFNSFGIVLLVLLLILLMTSFLVQNWYTTKNNSLQEALVKREQQLNQIQGIEKDIEYKQSIINKSSIGTKDFLSLYMSEIAKNVPSDILLKDVKVFPLKENIKPDEEILIEANKIVIEGVTESKFSVNEWVGILNDFSWTRKTELSYYTFENGHYSYVINLFL